MQMKLRMVAGATKATSQPHKNIQIRPKLNIELHRVLTLIRKNGLSVK